LKISKELLDYVVDGDLHTISNGVEHSTNLREIVTIAYMIEHGEMFRFQQSNKPKIKAPTIGVVGAR